jgi:hypothetical protein
MAPEGPIGAPADGRDAARVVALVMLVLFLAIMVLSSVTS